MLTEFRNFNPDRLDIHQLLALAAFGRMLRDEYAEFQVDEPEWVGQNLRAIRREIKAKNQDRLEARKRDLNAKLENLKTPAERKAELMKELTKLNDQLESVTA